MCTEAACDSVRLPIDSSKGCFKNWLNVIWRLSSKFYIFCSLDVLRAALRNLAIFPVETKVVWWQKMPQKIITQISCPTLILFSLRITWLSIVQSVFLRLKHNCIDHRTTDVWSASIKQKAESGVWVWLEIRWHGSKNFVFRLFIFHTYWPVPTTLYFHNT